jgi:hypothetical protein
MDFLGEIFAICPPIFVNMQDRETRRRFMNMERFTRLIIVGVLSAVMPCSALAACSASAAAAGGVTDSSGRCWRQLTDTTGFTYAQIAAVCPNPGQLCTGGPLIGPGGASISFSGWNWATWQEVGALFQDPHYNIPGPLTVSQYSAATWTGATFSVPNGPHWAFDFMYIPQNIGIARKPTQFTSTYSSAEAWVAGGYVSGDVSVCTTVIQCLPGVPSCKQECCSVPMTTCGNKPLGAPGIPIMFVSLGVGFGPWPTSYATMLAAVTTGYLYEPTIPLHPMNKMTTGVWLWQ